MPNLQIASTLLLPSSHLDLVSNPNHVISPATAKIILTCSTATWNMEMPSQTTYDHGTTISEYRCPIPPSFGKPTTATIALISVTSNVSMFPFLFPSSRSGPAQPTCMFRSANFDLRACWIKLRSGQVGLTIKA